MQTLPKSLIPEVVYPPPARKRRVQPDHETADPPVAPNLQGDNESNDIQDEMSSDKSTEEAKGSVGTETVPPSSNETDGSVNESEGAVNGDEVIITLQSENMEHALSIKELRRLCVEKGLSAAGRKRDLIDRLAAATN